MKVVKKFLCISLVFLLVGCGKPDIEIKGKLDFTLNEEVKVKDILIFNNGAKLDDPYLLLETHELGKKKIKIIYKKKKEDKVYKIEYNVFDKEKPVIEVNDKYETTVGTDLKLESLIKITDNSNEEIKPIITGDINYDKVGEYKVDIEARDLSGNKTKKEITIVVKEIPLKMSGVYAKRGSDYYFGFEFRKNGKVDYLYAPCSTGCGYDVMSGTYKIEGSKIEMNFTHMTSDVGPKEKLDEPFKETAKIINEKTIQSGKFKLTWKKSFKS